MSRGETAPAPRDNIILEFGLFAGVLGRTRTSLLATDALRLPTDVLGVTRLSYQPRSDGNLRAAVSSAALQLEDRVTKLGPRVRGAAPLSLRSPEAALAAEIGLLCSNVEAQGWRVRTNSATTLRLLSPNGKAHTLAKSRPEVTRELLRPFAAELRASGVRINSSLRRPVDASPF